MFVGTMYSPCQEESRFSWTTALVGVAVGACVAAVSYQWGAAMGAQPGHVNLATTVQTLHPLGPLAVQRPASSLVAQRPMPLQQASAARPRMPLSPLEFGPFGGLFGGGGELVPEDPDFDKYVKMEVLRPGYGTERPFKGKNVEVEYVGTLKNGKKFDAGTITFPVGVGRVIKGWDQAVGKMTAGQKAKITIQPEWGYGSRGSGGSIPPDSVLIFTVEILDLNF
uniref:peptidylprolyl isomerase n=1 Tax=Eutreptiella gymnastica TaxID=73025 RepID=A0A7S1I880_9EUGL